MVMSRHSIDAHELRRLSAGPGPLPDDLYGYVRTEAWPRAGRPEKCDFRDWTVSDDWSQDVPVTEKELDVFEAWFGDLFDELFGPCR
jgi:hypothetical protein